MNWNGSFANSVPPSRTVISDSTKAYVNSQHRMFAKAFYLSPAILKQESI
jgi:hypothetical protein